MTTNGQIVDLSLQEQTQTLNGIYKGNPEGNLKFGSAQPSLLFKIYDLAVNLPSFFFTAYLVLSVGLLFTIMVCASIQDSTFPKMQN